MGKDLIGIREIRNYCKIVLEYLSRKEEMDSIANILYEKTRADTVRKEIC